MKPESLEQEHLVGVISDTHGLLRPAVFQALAGCELIVHAGDVGAPHILEALDSLAPVVAVRGNVDMGAWAACLSRRGTVQVGEINLYVLHNVLDLDLDPAAGGYSAVISGHSHRPATTWRDGTLYLNPGSAGPRRFSLPIGVARLHVKGRALEAEWISLE